MRLLRKFIIACFVIESCFSYAQVFKEDSDTLRASEIAQLTSLRALTIKKIDGLIEIPMKKCSSKFVLFSNSNLWSTKIIVEILADGQEPPKSIKRIRFSNNKYLIHLPDTAFNDVQFPQLCSSNGQNSFCKVYQSIDKKRVYIYLISGKDKPQFEAIWVIKNSSYNYRVFRQII